MFGWKSLFRKRALDAQLDSELRFHIEKLTNDNIAAGMTPEEAGRQAVMEFGGREQIKEELRDVYRVRVGDWCEQRGILGHRRDSAATIAFPQRRPTDAPRSVQPQG